MAAVRNAIQAVHMKTMERIILAGSTAFLLIGSAHRADRHRRLTLTEEANSFCDVLHSAASR
jgi:hypothetical protein